MRYQDRERDEFDVLMWMLVSAVVLAAIVGLIEFNARRQAAAITREMLRPATAEEIRQLNENVSNAAAAIGAARPVRADRPGDAGRPTPAHDPRPLDADERCIRHQRFRRLDNGWASIGSC